MTSWDDRSLRRAFIHMQDAGQSRAFFVKFTGEGRSYNEDIVTVVIQILFLLQ